MAYVIPVSKRLQKVLGQLAEITKTDNKSDKVSQDNQKKAENH